MAAAGGHDSNVNNTLHRFHQRCGRRITLSNGNRTATRSVRDFSNALVFSEEPLQDNVLFEVIIDKKNLSWGGSIEIGVTSESPDKIELPSCATAMRNGTWVMSGLDVRKDGVCLVECYGTDLETLNERDRVGVECNSNNELFFYVNGQSMGMATRNMPRPLWALVDIYGRCVQVSICSNDRNLRYLQAEKILQNIDIPLSANVTVPASTSVPSIFSISSGSSLDVPNVSLFSIPANSGTISLPPNSICASDSNCSDSIINTESGLQNLNDLYLLNEKLRFHVLCGSLIKLSSNCRSAERRRPLDEFNNGVVMTHRPLKDNELFEIRIDKLVDKWSGSIEVGVTTHNPAVLHFPATMTNMRSGTIMMSGCGILTNGKGTRRQYGEFNLDELREGDRVGMMRKEHSNLHYYINGQDQGVAATRVATTLWGVIDLYGMTVKVTIVDRDDRELQNLVTRRMNSISLDRDERDQQNLVTRRANLMMIGSETSIGDRSINLSLHTLPQNLLSPEVDIQSLSSVGLTRSNSCGEAAELNQRPDDCLTFHPLCGMYAAVIYNGRTALRPNAADDFNNGIVLTRRQLRPNELFQVRLERVVAKWAGSVEMGVTTHSAEELDFPFTMTNVRSGTWMMTGNGVMHNGITVIEQYGHNLDRLQVGDRVGVVRKDDGTLHFFVNGVDQGVAATNLPENIYGVIDLYGQAAQASIIDTSECGSPESGNSTISNTTLYSEPPLRFHALHGKNVSLSNCGLTASRPNSLAEFNDAVLFTNRPLRPKELFEVTIDAMVRHWSGHLEIGVTGTRPEDIQIGLNATDLEATETTILCGSMIFVNRKIVRYNALIDLDTLQTGSRIGIMRNGDYLHLYCDGSDYGPICECRYQNIWGVIDLYGQCAQVTLVPCIDSQQELRAPYATSENSQSCQATSVIQPATLDVKHRWNSVSSNVTLSQNWTVATRVMGSTAALSHSMIFSHSTLSVGTAFEMKIVSRNPVFAGSLNIGVTDLNLSDEYVRKNIPFGIRRVPANVWFLSGNELHFNSKILQRSPTSLDWLRVGDRISLELTPARSVRVLVNSEDMNMHFHNVLNDLYAVIELQGSTMAVQVISTQESNSPFRRSSLRLLDSLEFSIDPLNKQDSLVGSINSERLGFEFLELHGKNVNIECERMSATRFQSYNHGLALINKPLSRGDSLTIKIDAINNKWKGSIGLGVIGASAKIDTCDQLPADILQCKNSCWMVTHDFININGRKIPSVCGAALENAHVGSKITMTLSHIGMLVITVGNEHLEDWAFDLPNSVYPVFDIYGRCEKITVINGYDCKRSAVPIVEVELPAVEQDMAQKQEIVQQEHQYQNEAAQQNENRDENAAVVAQHEKADLEVNEKDSDSCIQIS